MDAYTCTYMCRYVDNTVVSVYVTYVFVQIKLWELGACMMVNYIN